MTRRNFHEVFAHEEVALPSERTTGFVFAAIAAVFAYEARSYEAAFWTGAIVSAALLAVSLLATRVLCKLNVFWFRLSVLLSHIVTPAVMFIIFVAVFVPAGAVMRIWRDPLASQRTKNAKTYWIERSDTGGAASSMKNQF
jgi:hypothetical protein